MVLVVFLFCLLSSLFWATYDYPLPSVYYPLLPTCNSLTIKKVVFPTPLIHSVLTVRLSGARIASSVLFHLCTTKLLWHINRQSSFREIEI